MNQPIAESSPEVGLDFACSLISDAISAKGRSAPEGTSELLSELCSYIQFRYVGEPLLALEYLAGIGQQCELELSRGNQFWKQLRWVALKLEVSEADAEVLFPHLPYNQERG